MFRKFAGDGSSPKGGREKRVLVYVGGGDDRPPKNVLCAEKRQAPCLFRPAGFSLCRMVVSHILLRCFGKGVVGVIGASQGGFGIERLLVVG